ncbi:Serine/threonine-protein kinase tel1 [Microbotryomycetes sp. JL221]|nr:Serine/threonine-protein kinase tel1 [Microbotryomycetes sp. JL221]
MSARQWREVLDNIASGKTRERTQAVEDFRRILSSSHTLARINSDKSHSWTTTLQLLFGVVINERNDYAKKATAVSRKRLEDMTSLVAWTIERLHESLSARGIKSVLAHLAQILATDGAEAPHSLTYLRALRTVLEHAPHVDHLEEKQWVEIAAMCFGLALGERVRIGQDFADDEAMNYADDGDDQRVRRRAPLRVVDDDDVLEVLGLRKTSNHAEVEAMRVLEAAFRSKSSPFLAFSRVILVKFTKFFRQFASETSAHAPALTALNLALADLIFNDQEALRKIGSKLWPFILALWPTKNPVLKEQVIISLQYLLPAITEGDRSDGIFVGSRTTNLFEAILTEPTLRWRDAFELDLDHLSLRLDDGMSDTVKPYSLSTLSMGPDFSERDCATWAVLELGADSLAEMHDANDTPANNDILSPSGASRNKRRKVEAPLAAFLDKLSEADPNNLVASFRLQLMTFFVERHDRFLTPRLASTALTAIESNLKHSSLNVQAWALIAATALANRVHNIRELKVRWEQLWAMCARKLSRPKICRYAAHAANILLARDLVTSTLLSDTIESLSREMDVQGPDAPSDAVCLFFEWILAIAISDMRLYRLHVSDKILAWLVNSWTPLAISTSTRVASAFAGSLAKSSTSSNRFSPNGLCSLLARVCGMKYPNKAKANVLVPDCDLGTVAVNACEMTTANDFIAGRVPPYRREKGNKRSKSQFKVLPEVPEAGNLDMRLDRKISQWLQKQLKSIVDEADDLGDKGGDRAYWIGLTIDTVRRYLDLVSVTLAFEGILALNKRKQSRTTTKLASEVLSMLATNLGMSKWSATERAQLVNCLDIVLVPLEPYPAVELPVLLDPSHASDLPQHMLPKPDRTSRATVGLDSLTFKLYQHMWQQPETQVALNDVSTVLLSFVCGMNEEAANGGDVEMPLATQRLMEVEERERDDGFGEIKVANHSVQAAGRINTLRASQATAISMLRAAVTSEMVSLGARGLVRLQPVINAILQADGAVAIAVTEPLLTAVRHGLVSLSIAQAEAILVHLGNNLLPDRRFARDERFTLLGLRLLETSVDLWVLPNDSGAADELFSHARRLCAWYVSNLVKRILASWRVRLQLVAFLDVYLGVDRAQQHWDAGGLAIQIPVEHTRQGEVDSQGRQTKVVFLPTAILPSMLTDPDFRVRLRASSSAPALFTFMYENAVNSGPLFTDIRQNLKVQNLNEREQVMTGIVGLTNLVIASGNFRRAPYRTLLGIANASPTLANQVDAALAGVADRLGFTSLSGLYELFCRYCLHTTAFVTDHQALVPILPSSVGCATMHEVRQIEFPHVMPLLVQRENLKHALDALLVTVGKTKQQALLQCLPQVAATTILFGVRADVHTKGGGISLNTAVHKVEQFVLQAGAETVLQQETLLSTLADEMAVSMLLQLHEGMWDPEKPHPALADDRSVQETFYKMLALPSSIHLVEALPPYFDLKVVMQSIVWLQQSYPVFTHTAGLYAVLHRMFAHVQRVPFIDLQRDALIATALALAIGHRQVRQASILDVVLKHLIELFKTIELASIVVGMLKWAINQLLGLACPAEDLCSHLVKLAHDCHNHLQDSNIPRDARTLFEGMWTFLHEKVDVLAAKSDPIVAAAMLMLPWDPIDNNKARFTDFETILTLPFSPVNKFRLAAAITRQQPGQSSTPRSVLLWHLIDQVSDADTLSAPDCEAFAELLYQSGGVVESPGLLSLKQPHVRIDDTEEKIKLTVIELVLRTLDGPDVHIGFTAFETSLLLFASFENGFNLVNQLSLKVQDLASILASSTISRRTQLEKAPSRELACLDQPEWQTLAQDYDSWVKAFCQLLCEAAATQGSDSSADEGDIFFAQLSRMAKADTDFATSMLPTLVHALLFKATNSGVYAPRDILTRYLQKLLKLSTASQKTVKAIVDVSVYLRQHPRPDLERSLDNCDRWLDVSWILLASGATRTDMPLAALQFLELAHEYQSLFKKSKDGQPVNKSSDGEGQALLYKIYESIEEPDGFYGRQSSDVRLSVIKRFHHEQQWAKAFSMHGADFESTLQHHDRTRSETTAGVVQSLAMSGFNRLALSILQPARAEGRLTQRDVGDDLSHELAWRTTNWDLPSESQSLISPGQLSSSARLYSVLHQLQSPQNLVVESTQKAMIAETNKLASVSLHSPTPNAGVLSTILSLREIRSFPTWRVGDHMIDGLSVSLSHIPEHMSFEQADKILSCRITMLRQIRSQEQASMIGDMDITPAAREAAEVERSCLLKLSERARTSGRLQVALNAVTMAHKLVEEQSSSASYKVDEELAKVLWSQGEHSTAIRLLEEVSGKKPSNVATVFAQLGQWQVEARLRRADEILKTCFEPASRALDDSYNAKERTQVYSNFAQFADRQFHEAVAALEEKKERYITYKQRKQVEMRELDRQIVAQPDDASTDAKILARTKINARHYLEEDKKQLDALEYRVHNMLSKALTNYAQAIINSEDTLDLVLRFVALWLANSDAEALDTGVANLIDSIPSHRFVFLAYQLSARLSMPPTPTNFSQMLNKLVLRLCSEHPFHAFFPVNALRDSSGATSTSGKSGSGKTLRARRSSTAPGSLGTHTPSDRTQAANTVIMQVATVPGKAIIIESLEMICEAAREWAEYRQVVKENKDGTKLAVKGGQIPKSMKILSNVHNLPVPVLSYSVPVDPTAQYLEGSFPTIVRYDTTWKSAGGVNQPKVCMCLGSDGVRYIELMKGNDDMRQDAVMEQVFELVNKLLASDEQTRRRKLHLRTYKVLPMQNATGVIEWVQNTKPLGAVVEPIYDAAQTKMSHREARSKLGLLQREKAPNKDQLKLETFKEILSKLPPVMRHFFFQQQRLPSLWFEMRLNYSRSVATASIMGHVVGLGDRHMSNILMDEKSGEIVEIDFGIAFESGKRLPVPELVPFRLTQNIVDGFGSSGVEGVFRRCSEETLRVLRSRADVLLTVLEVFKHDPLQTWAVSAAVAKKVQETADEGEPNNNTVDEVPDDADRAFAAVRSKLDNQLSVEYTVNQLIQEATDIGHLARIYFGWKPYL